VGAPAVTSDVNELRDLVGLELSAVSFVRDYVEFEFDGPVLRSLASPIVSVDGVRWEFPHPGSRDAMCELIGRAVVEAQDLPERLLLGFAGDAIVEVPLSGEDAGPEVAHFIPMVNGKRHGESMRIWENHQPTFG
jgi:hypothetical protein